MHSVFTSATITAKTNLIFLSIVFNHLSVCLSSCVWLGMYGRVSPSYLSAMIASVSLTQSSLCSHCSSSSLHPPRPPSHLTLSFLTLFLTLPSPFSFLFSHLGLLLIMCFCNIPFESMKWKSHSQVVAIKRLDTFLFLFPLL